MSRDDFCRCTPSQFYDIWDKWRENEDGKRRDEWERTRTLAMFVAQPYSKKSLNPRKLMPLPWDRKSEDKPREKRSRKDILERFEEAKKKYGLGAI